MEDLLYSGREFDGKGPGFAPTGYCDSKLMNVMFTKELVKRYPHTRAYSLCPGLATNSIFCPVRSTPLSGSWTLELTWNLKDTVRGVALEFPGHCQKQLVQILCVCKNAK